MKSTSAQLPIGLVVALTCSSLVLAAGPLPTPAAVQPAIERRQLDPFVLSSVLASSASNADLQSYYDAVGKLLTDSSALSDYQAITASVEASVVSEYASNGGNSQLASSLASSVFAGIVSDASSRQAAGTNTASAAATSTSSASAQSSSTSSSSSSGSSNGAIAFPIGATAITLSTFTFALTLFLL